MRGSFTFGFIKFFLGLRSAVTTDTPRELDRLRSLAKNAKLIIEIGVFEGVASKVLAENSTPSAKVFLVDPYFKTSLLERALGISMSQYVAQRTTKKFSHKLEWRTVTSEEAASDRSIPDDVDLVFIDAMHDYEHVLQDFELWGPRVKEGGYIAFHDAVVCAARPDLHAQVGPVRLATEIRHGERGNWVEDGTADSLAVFRRG